MQESAVLTTGLLKSPSLKTAVLKLKLVVEFPAVEAFVFVLLEVANQQVRQVWRWQHSERCPAVKKQFELRIPECLQARA